MEPQLLFTWKEDSCPPSKHAVSDLQPILNFNQYGLMFHRQSQVEINAARLSGRTEAPETENRRQSSEEEIKAMCFARDFMKGKHGSSTPRPSPPFFPPSFNGRSR